MQVAVVPRLAPGYSMPAAPAAPEESKETEEVREAAGNSFHFLQRRLRWRKSWKESCRANQGKHRPPQCWCAVGRELGATFIYIDGFRMHRPFRGAIATRSACLKASRRCGKSP